VIIRSAVSEKTIERFWDKVIRIPFHECWEWIGAKNESGYGVFGIGGETAKAPRISYLLKKGSIPIGLFILHSCDNPGCVNPDHLRVGTAKENSMDAVMRKRASNPPPMGGWNKICIPPDALLLMGKIPDTDIAKKFNLGKTVISKRRRQIGIEAFPCQTKFKSGNPHPRWSRKEVI
jgi:HNH endonuclease